jgi:hypothetical protein
MKLCACGTPLHYLDKLIEDYVEADCLIHGEFVRFTVGGRTWQVSRHFVALHGVKPEILPELAEQYGFEEVRDGAGD